MRVLRGEVICALVDTGNGGMWGAIRVGEVAIGWLASPGTGGCRPSGLSSLT